MDDIQSAALAIEQLKNCVYEITLGRKGKLTRIILAFTEDDLHHLAGLHKLVDIEQIRSGKRSRIYESILSGTITGDFLKKSARYHEIEARIQALVYLEDMLDGDQLYFKYDPRKRHFHESKRTIWSLARQITRRYICFLAAGAMIHITPVFFSAGKSGLRRGTSQIYAAAEGQNQSGRRYTDSPV